MCSQAMYSLKKNCALWLVTMPSGKVVFKSLSRIRCVEFCNANNGQGE